MEPTGGKRLFARSANSAFEEADSVESQRESEEAMGNRRVEHPLLSLTMQLVGTYRRCGGVRFVWSRSSVPRRVLSKPNEAVSNGGMDNARGDLILSVNDELVGGTLGPSRVYVVQDLIGQGTFGQVVRAERQDTRELVAVKVVRNKPAYTKQGLIEIGIVEHLNRVDPDDRHHVVRLLDYFIHQNHVCLVFELLSVNLYELLKSNGYRGLSLNLVRVFVAQLLDGCDLLRRHSIVHCDLKPENILLQSVSSPVVKLIDFGSACYENHTSFSYIQSRFYRSPEVLLGLPYGMDIDMWSLGCIVAELYLGLPLFAGTSELEQLHLIQEALGPMPTSLLRRGSKVSKYYNMSGDGTWTLKSEEQFFEETGQKPRKHNKRYFFFNSLQELTRRYPTSSDLSENSRACIADLLSGLLRLDPSLRWTPEQARLHPLVTGETWVGPWEPPRVPIFQGRDSADSSASASPRQFLFEADSPLASPRRPQLKGGSLLSPRESPTTSPRRVVSSTTISASKSNASKEKSGTRSVPRLTKAHGGGDDEGTEETNPSSVPRRLRSLSSSAQVKPQLGTSPQSHPLTPPK